MLQLAMRKGAGSANVSEEGSLRRRVSEGGYLTISHYSVDGLLQNGKLLDLFDRRILSD